MSIERNFEQSGMAERARQAAEAALRAKALREGKTGESMPNAVPGSIDDLAPEGVGLVELEDPDKDPGLGKFSLSPEEKARLRAEGGEAAVQAAERKLAEATAKLRLQELAEEFKKSTDPHKAN